MRKQDGFENEVRIVVPPELYRRGDSICGQLHITAVGYFPHAAGHYVERSGGTDSSILIICTAGSGWVETGLTCSPLKRGEASVIPAGTPHRYGSADNAWWEIYWVHYSGESSGDMGQKISGRKEPVPFPLVPGEESMRLFSGICSGLQQGFSPLSYDLACSRFWHLCGSLGRDRSLGAPSGRGIIRDCEAFMEERISSCLSLDELSGRVSVTPQYLCRLFRRATGQSPMEHYTRMKIQRACVLLDMTDQRINEIGRQLGYEDPYYFTRTFKRIMGSAPRDYRKRQQ